MLIVPNMSNYYAEIKITAVKKFYGICSLELNFRYPSYFLQNFFIISSSLLLPASKLECLSLASLCRLVLCL